MRPNDVIYFDNGKVIGIVENVDVTEASLNIKSGGTLKGLSQVRFVGGNHKVEEIVRKDDLLNLQQISQSSIIDFIAVPFVMEAADVKFVRECLGPHGKNISILAKIDTLEGLKNYESIIDAADGVIVVRNELHWEVSPEKMVIAQKWLIDYANSKGKMVMIQSQVLESMVTENQPTR